jgi:hypothetical protein
MDFTYDALGQLATALGRDSFSLVRPHENFGYTYDPAGNLDIRTKNALSQDFNVNDLNELTTTSRSGTLTVAGAVSISDLVGLSVNSLHAPSYNDRTFYRDGFSLNDGENTFTAKATDSLFRTHTHIITVNLPATVNFAYDANGNLTGDGARVFTYDDENQLIRVEVAGEREGNGVNAVYFTNARSRRPTLLTTQRSSTAAPRHGRRRFGVQTRFATQTAAIRSS